MNSLSMLIPAAMLIPVLAALAVLVTGKKPNLREAVSITAGILLFATVLKLHGLLGSTTVRLELLEILPGLSIAFSLDQAGMLFALIASFLWIVTTVYAIGYMRGHNEQNQTRFFTFFAISISAVMGIAFADNLLTLFVFYEVLTLCTYPLVTHAGTDKARKGGQIYLRILLITSIGLLLPALIGTWMLAGTLDFVKGGIFPAGTSDFALSVLLVLFVFGVGKAAMMPIHRWLPSAMVAPTPVSALLHAVAVVKAGVFTLLKVGVFIFGIDTLAAVSATDWLLYLAGASILLASVTAMRQDNLKARLAYSTVSQLGYISLGVLLASQAGVAGSALHIVMHAFGKITLFFCAGAILVASHKSEISQMRGLGKQMPITMMAFFIGSMSIIGLPPTGGTWSKWLLMVGTFEAHHLALMGVLMLSSLLNIAYLLPIPIRGFFSTDGQKSADQQSIQEAPLPALIALSLTALISIALFFYPHPFAELANHIL